MIQKLIRLPISLMFGRGYWPVASQEGLRLYYVNHAQWGEVESAKVIHFLFLPHLKIRLQRRKATSLMRSWYFPLYFWGVEKFLDNVQRLAPADSPLRAVVTPELELKCQRVSPKGLFLIALMSGTFLAWAIVFIAQFALIFRILKF